MTMKFEWDERKNWINIRNHGLDFADANEMFYGPMVVKLDSRFDYGEERWIGIGLVGGVICAVVVYVEREEVIRIISFRKADRYERESFEREIKNGLGTG